MRVFGQERITCVRLVQASDASDRGDERGLTQDDWTFFHFFSRFWRASKNIYSKRIGLFSIRLEFSVVFGHGGDYDVRSSIYFLMRSLFIFRIWVTYFEWDAQGEHTETTSNHFFLHSLTTPTSKMKKKGNRNNNIKWYFIQMWVIRSSATVSQLVSQNAWYVWLFVHFAGAPDVSAVAVVISKWIKFFIRSRCRCSSLSGSRNIFFMTFRTKQLCRFIVFLLQKVKANAPQHEMLSSDTLNEKKIVIKKNWLAVERNWMRAFFHHQQPYYFLWNWSIPVNRSSEETAFVSVHQRNEIMGTSNL